MIEIGLYALYAILLWWVSTGVVLYLDGLPARTFSFSLACASLFAAIGLGAIWWTASWTTPLGALVAFTGALAIWGWHELTFLTGRITGPRRMPMTPGITGLARFREAALTISDHEIGIVVAAAVVGAVTWGEANQVGLATFCILWVMRLSTKLNIFLGAPNIPDEFLPAHLDYLKSYFRREPMNFLFPFAVTAATLLTAYLAHRALAAEANSYQMAAYGLLTVLSGLAVLEHWLLYVPVPASRLWEWGMASHRLHRNTRRDDGSRQEAGSARGAALTSSSWTLDRPCDVHGLSNVLEGIVKGRYGDVERVEGAARSRDGWLRFEVRNGRPFLALVQAPEGGTAIVTATGRAFDKARLGAAFLACAA